VNEGFRSDRTDLTGCNQTRQWQTWKSSLDSGRIMMRGTKQRCAAPVAGSQQSGDRLFPAQAQLRLEQGRSQIKIGGGCISELKLDRLTDPGPSTERDGAQLPVDPNDVTNQEIAAAE
jgi:hypothetical protein